MDFVAVYNLLEKFGFKDYKCFDIATRYVAGDEDAKNVVGAVRARLS